MQWRIQRFEGSATTITKGLAKCSVICSVSCLIEEVELVEPTECDNTWSETMTCGTLSSMNNTEEKNSD